MGAVAFRMSGCGRATGSGTGAGTARTLASRLTLLFLFYLFLLLSSLEFSDTKSVSLKYEPASSTREYVPLLLVQEPGRLVLSRRGPILAPPWRQISGKLYFSLVNVQENTLRFGAHKPTAPHGLCALIAASFMTHAR